MMLQSPSSRTEQNLQCLMDRFSLDFEDFGLAISLKKTNVVVPWCWNQQIHQQPCDDWPLVSGRILSWPLQPRLQCTMPALLAPSCMGVKLGQPLLSKSGSWTVSTCSAFASSLASAGARRYLTPRSLWVLASPPCTRCLLNCTYSGMCTEWKIAGFPTTFSMVNCPPAKYPKVAPSGCTKTSASVIWNP